MVDVTIEAEAAVPGELQMVLVKLQSSTWELNFRATSEQLLSLQGIRDAVWADRRCLPVGTSAGAAVHWSASGDIATVMVGDDDEAWDIAIEVPIASLDEIVTGAARRTLGEVATYAAVGAVRLAACADDESGTSRSI